MASPFSRIAVDANGNVATLDINCNLTIYNAPLSSPLIPSVTLSSGANCRPGFVVGLAFNASGDLFVTNGGSAINVFLHPLSSTSTVSQVITVPNFARDLEFDATGNLYVASEIGGLCSFINNTVYIFIPPYTSAPATLGAFCGDFAFSSVAVSQTQMFVSQDNGFVRVFDLPATATSNSFLLTTTSNVGATLGVDHSGNLYVNDGQIHVFALPVSPASTPSVTLNVKVGDITFKP